MIHNSDAAVSNFFPGATWIYDGMAIMRSIKPKSTFGEFFDSFIKLVTPPKSALATSIEIIMDCYYKNSIKDSTRQKRGNTGSRVYITSSKLKMPQGDKWNSYFNLDIPITITEEENTIRIDHSGWRYLAICDSDCVIVSKDTDVFLLLIYAFYKCNSQKTWYMKYDNEKFVDIGKVFTYLGIHMTDNILKFHSLTGCDTTSYFFRVGKIKVWKKLLKSPAKINLINSLGLTKDLSINGEQNCQKFMQTVMYNGTEEEEYIGTRVRLYKKQSTKTLLYLNNYCSIINLICTSLKKLLIFYLCHIGLHI